MASSKISKRAFNMAYGIGAAIVIIGALFKIMHFKIGPLTGGLMLSIGMAVEAIIFFLSAFEPVEEDLDWTKVYPELAGGESSSRKGKQATVSDAQSMLSKKLDDILRDAKLDTQLISGLGDSIKSFQSSVQPLADASQSIASTTKYNQQMVEAAIQMQTLNNLYKTQVENASKQTALNTAMVENSQKLQQQMDALARNLESLNNVYGGMLSAMNKN